MKINSNIRVVKSPSGTEVFIQSTDPITNFVLHLPLDVALKSGESIEFTHVEPKPLSKEEATKRAKELPGQIEPAIG